MSSLEPELNLLLAALVRRASPHSTSADVAGLAFPQAIAVAVPLLVAFASGFERHFAEHQARFRQVIDQWFHQPQQVHTDAVDL